MQDSLREYKKDYLKLHENDTFDTDEELEAYNHEVTRVDWEISQLQK